MESPEAVVKHNLECNIFSLELDLKLLRKKLIVTTEDETNKMIIGMIDQVEKDKAVLDEKLLILNSKV